MYGKSACPVLGGAGEQLKVWLRYCGTAGKPGGERIKQTSAYSHGKPPVYSTFEPGAGSSLGGKAKAQALPDKV